MATARHRQAVSVASAEVAGKRSLEKRAARAASVVVVVPVGPARTGHPRMLAAMAALASPTLAAAAAAMQGRTPHQVVPVGLASSSSGTRYDDQGAEPVAEGVT